MQIDIDAKSVIGAGSEFFGKYKIDGNLRIDGKFEGENLYVEHIQIGPQARVKTDVQAVSIVVEGIVIGNLNATTRILLLSTARVLGNIKTPELIIQDGVVLEGSCTINHYELENTKDYVQGLYDEKEQEQPPVPAPES